MQAQRNRPSKRKPFARHQRTTLAHLPQRRRWHLQL